MFHFDETRKEYEIKVPESVRESTLILRVHCANWDISVFSLLFQLVGSFYKVRPG